MSKTIFSGEQLKFGTAGGVQILSADDSAPVIGGHGAVYFDGTPGTEYTDPWWGVTLRLKQGCMDACMATSDPWSFFNHDANYLLGRKGAGTFTMALDSKGCSYQTMINPRDAQAMSVYAKVERGDCTGSSMMFYIADSYDEKLEDGRYIEWITRIEPLLEMGPVVNPAMKSANSVAMSEESLHRFRERREQRDRKISALARHQKRKRELAMRKYTTPLNG